MSTDPVLLLTRPRAASERFLSALDDAGITGFRAIVSPLLAIRRRPALPPIDPEATLVFTSANAVQAYAALGGPEGRVTHAVGDATAAAARAIGLDAVSAGGDIDALFAHLVAERVSGPVVHLRGAISRGDLAGRLRAAGIDAADAVLYDQPVREFTSEAQDALAGPIPVVAPLFSPRTARAFALHRPFGAPILAAAMSEAVAEAFCPAAPHKLAVAIRPDAAAMVVTAAELLVAAAALETGGGAE
ncbi:uroporphyrinogen-III synthase [Roseivivax sediminis]|uniref:Uroporphyrinogen-III synthase n=1 Tax=Roseivivax sediminis TaxID=936889 RepID=A0A1I1UGG2_9RHOB|nr:uroporphyrinogen-III synthase [Roseivivax sediminis]SFD67853.1 uroporphyrinogen-III synthase [Roseivivax sediminis]